ncbi:DNA polymerase IV [Gemmata obscuriglobus]|uniref:Nucleotidyltransferase n=1 Tax=Gemmata obscuriglobus TaxID=114 RepID=A0A2Z3GNV2_9BACT|nr:nucleotidyltransferase [Gemmata obscuriglobus]AWM35929.1 nucleotidyltransferase [Gemmata obscuriglobus]QEG31515.1 DNA polymerase IV [Gemmata obscuriglobus]VTS10857.1 dna-directed dna polymerase : Nucleotidyltransferase/DNA polymerase involved in DNA repair OS=Singulisphaera acidiphila (strain ATCC BAA-1392 / DSM 18658 / VKM B-2454 / MOB10) GN=Sinac_0546 PE=4 SV=1: IMS: IMS_C [Gemmata obscuriglobus UQM 2246]
MPGFIAHLDADCFYVSAERVRHPELEGKPVGVLGNNGACVIAKSYEMKRDGVKTGTPIWEAKKLCSDGVYMKRDFYWYEVLSRKMLGIVGSFAPSVEYYSIDEFFFECRELSHRTSLAETATKIRDHILAVAGLPVTIGVARTRTLAKLFSDTGKPFGAVAVLNREHERELLSRMPVTEISGIAGRRAVRLAPYGIRTCLDLADADGRLVNKLLTKTGYEIWLELNGTQVLPIRPERAPHQVLTRGGSLMGDVSDPAQLWAWTVRNLERLIEELRYHNVRTDALAISLAWKGGGETGGGCRLPTASDRFDELLDAARTALRRAYVPHATATHMHVIAPELRRGRGIQLTLFDEPKPKLDAVASAKEAINARYGRFKVRSGATLFLPKVYRDPATDFDICDVRGKVCF